MSGAIFALVNAIPWNKVVDGLPVAIEHAQTLTTSLRRRKAGPPDLQQIAVEGPDLLELVRMGNERAAALQAELDQAMELVLRLTETQARIIGQIERMRQWLIGLCLLTVVALVGTIMVFVTR